MCSRIGIDNFTNIIFISIYYALAYEYINVHFIPWTVSLYEKNVWSEDESKDMDCKNPTRNTDHNTIEETRH